MRRRELRFNRTAACLWRIKASLSAREALVLRHRFVAFFYLGYAVAESLHHPSGDPSPFGKGGEVAVTLRFCCDVAIAAEAEGCGDSLLPFGGEGRGVFFVVFLKKTENGLYFTVKRLYNNRI